MNYRKFLSILRDRYKKAAIIDIILILSAVLGLAFFLYVFFRKSDYVIATIKVGDESVNFNDGVDWNGTRPWFTEIVHGGDVKQKDGLGRTVAEVLSVQSYDIRYNRKALYIKVRFKAVYEKSSGQYVYNGLPLVIGSYMRIPFSTVSVQGLVTKIEGLPDFRQKAKLIVEAKLEDESSTYLQTSGVSPYVASEILNTNEIKDGEGNVIIKILQKKVEDANVFVATADGTALVRKNPLRKDVYLTLEVDVTKIGNRYYLFDDMPILIGQTMPLNTTKLSVFPIVTKITIDEN